MTELAFSEMFRKNSVMFRLLPLLLKDCTTGKNIVWATDTYSKLGSSYQKESQMFTDRVLELITNGTILPRVQKDKAEQQSRTKTKAEVFTPSWICNKMNNFCDEQWFMRKDVFNKELDDHTWIPSEKPVKFGEPLQKDVPEWQRYVDSRRIEITCGEAPYIVSRYDTTTGELLALDYRIGILDRKLRIVNENTTDETEWLEWAVRAFEATYGFEYQGDNLFLARINLIQTFMDYYEDRFGYEPAYMTVKKVATIVTWNIWQMDGLKDVAPYGVPEDEFKQLSLFEDEDSAKPAYCKIKDWRSKKTIEYRSMKGDGAK